MRESALLLNDKFKKSGEYKTTQDSSTICPHFREWNMACCLAGNTGVVLAFMVRVYCRSSNHKNCLFFADLQRSIDCPG